jgi:hypothetical protein
MLSIDSAVLDLTEWLCRRFQRLTGRTNVWLAVQLTNLSIILYFLWVVVFFGTANLSTRVAVWFFCSAVMYALSQTLFKDSIETHETYAFRRVARGLRNPRRVRDALLRISFLNLSLVLLGPAVLLSSRFPMRFALAGYLLIVLTTVVLYLLACDPLPPCEAKVKEWVRALFPARLVSESSVENR